MKENTEYQKLEERRRMAEEISKIRKEAEKILPKLRDAADEANEQVAKARQALEDSEQKFGDLRSRVMKESLLFEQRISSLESVLRESASPEIFKLQKELRDLLEKVRRESRFSATFTENSFTGKRDYSISPDPGLIGKTLERITGLIEECESLKLQALDAPVLQSRLAAVRSRIGGEM